MDHSGLFIQFFILLSNLPAEKKAELWADPHTATLMDGTFDNVSYGVYYLFQYHRSVLTLAMVSPEITAQLSELFDDGEWKGMGRASLAEIASDVRLQLSGRPVLKLS